MAASGGAKTDVVIGQADAQTLRQLSSKGESLQVLQSDYCLLGNVDSGARVIVSAEEDCRCVHPA